MYYSVKKTSFLNTCSFVRSEQKRPFLRPDHAIAWPPRTAERKGSSQGTRLQGAKRPKMGWKIPFRGASTAGGLEERERALGPVDVHREAMMAAARWRVAT